MPALVGTLSLAMALALALYGGIAAIVGARTGRPRVVESARTAAYSLFALVVVANLAMLAALLANDFSLRYVASNSSRETPTFVKMHALWSADEGSLLLWNLVLGGYLAAVAFRFRRRRPETFPWALAVMFGISAFYLILVLGPTTPFATLATAPPDGRGPLPLLQNHPLMAAHPPFLYLGFIGFTVPFAFAIAALITGRVSDAWMRITRRWTISAWIFLTVGLTLGALWSYSVLGWGGYWAWDPVENLALLPWLMGTAFLHSVMVQERRGMLKVWNLSLIVGTFALTVLGTFLTRGSILASVHAFAESIVGPLYLAFLTLVLLGGFGLIAWRRESLRAEATLDTPLSRESVFLGNNVLLLVLTFTVLIGTIYPLVAEMVRGVQAQRRAHGISVGAAIGSAVARNHRLYGGLVVHLGLIVAVVGVSWAALADRSSEVTIARGEIAHAEGYDLRYDGLTTREEPQRRVLVADLTVLDPETGDEVVHLQPSLNLYPSASEPIGTPSIRTGTPFNGMVDLYASLVTVEDDTRASFRFFVNPGIGLVWLGGAVMALGGIVAAWPTRPRAATPRGLEPLAERR